MRSQDASTSSQNCSRSMSAIACPMMSCSRSPRVLARFAMRWCSSVLTRSVVLDAMARILLRDNGRCHTRGCIGIPYTQAGDRCWSGVGGEAGGGALHLSAGFGEVDGGAAAVGDDL